MIITSPAAANGVRLGRMRSSPGRIKPIAPDTSATPMNFRNAAGSGDIFASTASGMASFMRPASRKMAASSPCTVHSRAVVFLVGCTVVSPSGSRSVHAAEPAQPGSTYTTSQGRLDRQLGSTSLTPLAFAVLTPCPPLPSGEGERHEFPLSGTETETGGEDRTETGTGGEDRDERAEGGGLPAGNRSDDEERLRPLRDGVRQRRVGRLVGEVLRAGKEPQERPALEGDVVADGPAQHRIPGLECVEDRRPRGPAIEVELHLVAHVRQGAQMRRKDDADHGNVWTSTDSTAGRSRTMGAQLSPASADAYTCPPVVPKYTPQRSSASTAIASRNTLT